MEIVREDKRNDVIRRYSDLSPGDAFVYKGDEDILRIRTQGKGYVFVDGNTFYHSTNCASEDSQVIIVNALLTWSFRS